MTPEEKAVQLADDESRTTAVGLARYAFEFIKGAQLIEHESNPAASDDKLTPVPALFLVMHGLELTLKAYLRQRGLTLAQLMNLGHKVHKVYVRALSEGLGDLYNPTSLDASTLQLLDAMNEGQALRYIKTGAVAVPPWPRIEPFAIRLHQAVAHHVGFKSFNTHYPSTWAEDWLRSRDDSIEAFLHEPHLPGVHQDPHDGQHQGKIHTPLP